MKNNKGFTVVELIASFALTMVITTFLFEVLIEVKDIFVETSLKTNIQEKLGIISKNIRYNCSGKTCNVTLSANGSNYVFVNGQKFKLPNGVIVQGNGTKVTRGTEGYYQVKLTLTSSNLSKDYKYNAIYYYSTN